VRTLASPRSQTPLQTTTAKPKPPGLDPETGIVYSPRLRGGFPLGGIGTGTVDLRTDGTFATSTLNNNASHPIENLPGCFFTVWTKAGDRTLAKTLSLNSEYGLPGIAGMEFAGSPPIARVRYVDDSLPVELRLEAYSPRIPHDAQSSSLPVALFVFTARNIARAPVSLSIAGSWEALLGVGGSAQRGAFSDRTGNTVSAVPSSEGIFGMRMASPALPAVAPPDRMRYNARGEYALLAEAPGPDTLVTTGSWNVLDKQPGWWKGFAAAGTVEGASGAAVEGKLHPAAVVALKADLKAGETRTYAFAVAWHTPRQYTVNDTEFGHFYENSFDTAVESGHFALQNRLGFRLLTEEWQHLIERSTLPGWLQRRMIADTAILASNSLFTRDAGIAPPDRGAPFLAFRNSALGMRNQFDRIEDRLYAFPILSTWLPQYDRETLRRLSARQMPSGVLPDGDIFGDPTAQPTSPPDASGEPRRAAAWVWQVARAYLWTGDTKLLDELYPSCKRAATRLLSIKQDTDPGSGPMRYAVFAIAGFLADRIGDRRFATDCRSAALTALKTPPQVNSDDQVAQATWGQWLIASLGIEPPPVSAASQTASFGSVGAPVSAAARIAPVNDISYQLAAQSSQMVRNGQVKEGIESARSQVAELDKRTQSPWRLPDSTDTSQSNGFIQSASGTLRNSGSWSLYEALLGLTLDLPTGSMTLMPKLEPQQRAFAGPVFAPTFWAWAEYKVSPSRAVLTFRFDRFIPAAAPVQPKTDDKPKAGGLQPSGGITFRQVTIPIAKGLRGEVSASLGRAPIPGKLERIGEDKARYTFDTPIRLLSGNRLEFSVR
jgi:uncharacterized protein (DUF608 family)